MNGTLVSDDHVHGTAPANGAGCLGRATEGLGGEERSQPTGGLRSMKKRDVWCCSVFLFLFSFYSRALQPYCRWAKGVFFLISFFVLPSSLFSLWLIYGGDIVFSFDRGRFCTFDRGVRVGFHLMEASRAEAARANIFYGVLCDAGHDRKRLIFANRWVLFHRRFWRKAQAARA